MNTAKFNIFISTLNLLLIIVGYQFATSIFSPIMTESEASRIVTIPFRGLSLFISLIAIFLNYKSKFKLHAVIKVLLFYWLLIIIRFVYDMYFRDDVFVNSDKVLQVWLYMIPMTLIPIYSIIKSFKYIDFNKLLFWSFVLISISIVITYLTNESFQEQATERLQSNYAVNTISSGNFGLTAIIISMFLFFNFKRNLLLRIFSFVIVLFGFLVLLKSGSRGPLLSLFVVITFLLLSFSKNKIFNVIIVVLIFSVGYLLINYLYEIINYFSPILAKRLIESSSGRNYLFNYAFNSFLENPIIGNSFAIYSRLTGEMIYSHNIIIDSLMQLGLMGGLLIVYIIIKSFYKILDLIKNRSVYLWLGLLLLQEISGNMVSGAFYLNPILSVLIVLLFLPLDRDNYSLQKINNKV